MKNLVTILGLLLGTAAHAQFAFRYESGIPVTIGDRTLTNPWAGGLNATQFSRMHLDGDAVEDLVVFDRTTNRISTFLAEAQGTGYRWRHAPQYASLFPVDIRNWMLLVDYDGDGRRDLFTYAPAGLRIFRNVSANGRPAWEVAVDPVYAERSEGSGRINLFVVATDVPAILDADDDGDTDILTFDLTGDVVDFYRNMAVERNKAPGTLEFRKAGFCWGNFRKEFCDDFQFGINCNDPAGGRIAATDRNARVKHNGNAMLLVDLDGDGKRDLLFGHVSCDNIARLNNTGGNGTAANFTSFNSNFPAADPIRMPVFPAAYAEDLDFDGKRDLLASPNTAINEGNLSDFRASAWFYRNAGTNERPDYRLVTRSFLQEDMIDLGENAAPALADLDGDGDLDLLLGQLGQRGEQGLRAGLTYFENTGTAGRAAFTQRSADYLNLSGAFQLTDLRPSFADLDGNGTLDLVLVGYDINRRVVIRYLPNQGPRNGAFRLEVGSLRTVTTPDRVVPGEVLNWLDIDRDGRADLLIGKGSGVLEYHRNTGTGATVQLTLQQADYGQLGAAVERRTSSAVSIDLNGDGRPELLLGVRSGELKLYQLPDRPDGRLTALDTTLVYNELTRTDDPVGVGLSPLLASGDLDGDGLPDLLAGTLAGGVRLLRNTSEKAPVTGLEPLPNVVWAYPNPTDRIVYLKPPADGWLTVYNALGQPVRPRLAVKAQTETQLDLVGLPAGVYTLQLQESRRLRTQKIVLSR